MEYTAKKETKRKQVILRRLSVEEKGNLYKKHERLLFSIAKKYADIFPDLTVSYLMQAGSFGLFKAGETFDEERNRLFYTHAYWGIRGAITRTLTKEGRMIRLPANVVEDLVKCCKVEGALFNELGRDPSIKEISIKTNVPIDHVGNVRRAITKLTPLSLDDLIDKEKGEKTVVEFIVDKKTDSPVESTSKNILLAELKEFFKDNLSPKKQKIISLKFGFKDGRCHTHKEIGKKMHLTVSGIGQIVNAIFRQTREHFNLSKDGL